jgi:transposase
MVVTWNGAHRIETIYVLCLHISFGGVNLSGTDDSNPFGSRDQGSRMVGKIDELISDGGLAYSQPPLEESHT